MRSGVVLLALLLVGCAQPLVGVPVPSFEVDEAVAAWQYAHLPYGEYCAFSRGELRVQEVDPEALPLTCHSDIPACVATPTSTPCLCGCFVTQRTLIATTERNNTPALRAHEMMHWLDWCGRHGVDFGHEDPAVWGDHGVLRDLGY